MNLRKASKMDYVALTERLIKALAKNSEAVTVKEFPSEDPKKIEIEVLVEEEDLPRVIGRNGHNINAVRTILKASSSLNDHKYININVESF